MDPIEKRELKRRAFAKLAAQKRRAGLLRGRVVVISLLCFAVLWGVVFAQMITGNDPALAAKEAARTTRTVASAKREVETTETRELERRRAREAEEGAREEAQAEPEEEEPVAVEAEEVAVLEAEEAAAIEAEEIAAAEAAEAETLVTSQS